MLIHHFCILIKILTILFYFFSQHFPKMFMQHFLSNVQNVGWPLTNFDDLSRLGLAAAANSDKLQWWSTWHNGPWWRQARGIVAWWLDWWKKKEGRRKRKETYQYKGHRVIFHFGGAHLSIDKWCTTFDWSGAHLSVGNQYVNKPNLNFVLGNSSIRRLV
jgi:hypothetical protein